MRGSGAEAILVDQVVVACCCLLTVVFYAKAVVVVQIVVGETNIIRSGRAVVTLGLMHVLLCHTGGILRARGLLLLLLLLLVIIHAFETW